MGVIWLNSFFDRTMRRALIPQTCGPPPWYRRDLNGNRHLEHPALVEPSRAHVPDPIPVEVEQVLIDELCIH